MSFRASYVQDTEFNVAGGEYDNVPGKDDPLGSLRSSAKSASIRLRGTDYRAFLTSLDSSSHLQADSMGLSSKQTQAEDAAQAARSRANTASHSLSPQSATKRSADPSAKSSLRSEDIPLSKAVARQLLSRASEKRPSPLAGEDRQLAPSGGPDRRNTAGSLARGQIGRMHSLASELGGREGGYRGSYVSVDDVVMRDDDSPSPMPWMKLGGSGSDWRQRADSMQSGGSGGSGDYLMVDDGPSSARGSQQYDTQSRRQLSNEASQATLFGEALNTSANGGEVFDQFNDIKNFWKEAKKGSPPSSRRDSGMSILGDRQLQEKLRIKSVIESSSPSSPTAALPDAIKGVGVGAGKEGVSQACPPSQTSETRSELRPRRPAPLYSSVEKRHSPLRNPASPTGRPLSIVGGEPSLSPQAPPPPARTSPLSSTAPRSTSFFSPLSQASNARAGRALLQLGSPPHVASSQKAVEKIASLVGHSPDALDELAATLDSPPAAVQSAQAVGAGGRTVPVQAAAEDGRIPDVHAQAPRAHGIPVLRVEAPTESHDCAADSLQAQNDVLGTEVFDALGASLPAADNSLFLDDVTADAASLSAEEGKRIRMPARLFTLSRKANPRASLSNLDRGEIHVIPRSQIALKDLLGKVPVASCIS